MAKERDNLLRDLTVADLRVRLETEREAYRSLRFSHAVSSIENPCKIRYARRLLARIKTIIKEKETAQ